ncbi:unnamed protein product [Prunus armeniaca]
MQDNTAAVDEEEPPSSANKLLNHWLRFSSVVVVSKTFTTAETMLNARTLREWISSSLGLVQCQHFFKYMNSNRDGMME